MGKLCMELVEQDVFFDFISDYHTIASAPDERMMKFTGKHSGDCVGRIMFGEEHKKYYINTSHNEYYINTSHNEPAIIITITDDGVVQHGIAGR